MAKKATRPARKSATRKAAPAKKATTKKSAPKKAAPASSAKPGISDASVQAKTGRTWEEWFTRLDRLGAAKLDHKGIVALLASKEDISGWWQQSVTVEYERARGLRNRLETSDGFQAGANRTIAAPADALFKQLNVAASRKRLLGGDLLNITTATPGKTIRGAWGATRGRVDIAFYPKPGGKTQVSVSHRRLESAEEATETKAYWKDVLSRLEQSVTGE